MTRPRTLHAGLGALAVAGVALSGTVGTASARITVLDDDAATIARAIAPRPGGAYQEITRRGSTRITWSGPHARSPSGCRMTTSPRIV